MLMKDFVKTLDLSLFFLGRNRHSFSFHLSLGKKYTNVKFDGYLLIFPPRVGREMKETYSFKRTDSIQQFLRDWLGITEWEWIDL